MSTVCPIWPVWKNKQTKSAKLKSDTYFWCVNKNNLVSTRDEGSGNEDKDGKGYPGLILKKKVTNQPGSFNVKHVWVSCCCTMILKNKRTSQCKRITVEYTRKTWGNTVPCFSSCQYSQLVEGRLKDLKATSKTNDQRLHSTVKDGVILLKSTFFLYLVLFILRMYMFVCYTLPTFKSLKNIKALSLVGFIRLRIKDCLWGLKSDIELY